MRSTAAWAAGGSSRTAWPCLHHPTATTTKSPSRQWVRYHESMTGLNLSRASDASANLISWQGLQARLIVWVSQAYISMQHSVSEHFLKRDFATGHQECGAMLAMLHFTSPLHSCTTHHSSKLART